MKIRSILLPALALSFASGAALSMDVTRAKVRADLAAWQGNPVSADGYRFVGGELGHVYEPPRTTMGSGTGTPVVTRDRLQHDYQQFRARPVTADGYRFVDGEVGYVLDHPASTARATRVSLMGSGTGAMPAARMSMQRDRFDEHAVSADGYRFMGGDLGYEYLGIAR
ncbi:MAG TPA: DUF4148 domain-containing protein [Burkholderiaceae bacterium]|nr:DUF4148 domain-containing protein [Burkholderiaceae bacterium]